MSVRTIPGRSDNSAIARLALSKPNATRRDRNS
jgi:hypothetical protein